MILILNDYYPDQRLLVGPCNEDAVWFLWDTNRIFNTTTTSTTTTTNNNNNDNNNNSRVNFRLKGLNDDFCVGNVASVLNYDAVNIHIYSETQQ
jgi:hypothetical protein